LTILGIFIGIAAIVSLISLGQGLQKGIDEEFKKAGSDRIVISAGSQKYGPVAGSITVSEMTDADLSVIKKVSGVDLAMGVLVENVLMEFDDTKKEISFYGSPTDPDARKLIDSIDFFQIESGRQLKASNSFKANLGYVIAHDYFDREIKVGDRIEVEGYKFEIVGVQKKAGTGVHDVMVRVPLSVARDILDEPDKYSTIFVKVNSEASSSDVAADIKKELRQYRSVKEGEEDFSVQTPEELLGSAQTILNVVQAILIGIASISLIVGGVGIMNSMYTSVLERRRDIGVMKAIGFRNNEILSIFLVEAGVLGMVGGIIGIMIGVGIGKAVEYAAYLILGSRLLIAYFSPWLILGGLAFSFGVGCLSGYYPAKQAAEMKPVDALRQW